LNLQHRNFLGAASWASAIVLTALSAHAQDARDEDLEVPVQPAPSGEQPAPTGAPPAAAPAPAPSAPPAPAPAPASPSDATVKELQELRRRQVELEQRLRALEEAKPRAPAEPTKKPEQVKAAELEASAWTRPVPFGFTISGYVQGQYESSALSEDQLLQGDSSRNFDRFSVRRARLRVDHGWEHASALIELDGNSFRHSVVALRRAEASLLWRGPDRQLPLAMLTLGLIDQPFGYELMESARVRRFMERTQASRALFPTEPDVGARLYGAVGFFRYGLALVNGVPVDDERFIDPNANKDILGRIGAEALPLPELRVSGGVSFLTGKGFHPGRGADKGILIWTDTNEDGVLGPGETSAVPTGTEASENFDRWAFGADVELSFETALGWTAFSAEAVAASNLDRGLFVADPTLSSIDTRELGFQLSIVQDVTEWAYVGFRYDVYDPDTDFLASEGGRLVPKSQAIKTFSPLIGLQLRDDRARLSFQYDVIREQLGKDARGVPTDLDNNQWTLRLQVNL
jgi:hypothetical protein